MHQQTSQGELPVLDPPHYGLPALQLAQHSLQTSELAAWVLPEIEASATACGPRLYALLNHLLGEMTGPNRAVQLPLRQQARLVTHSSQRAGYWSLARYLAFAGTLHSHPATRSTFLMSPKPCLQRLMIRGYRPFKNFHAQLGSLKVLVGANGAGKSGLFTSIKFIWKSLKDDIPPEIVGGSVGQQLFHRNGPEQFWWVNGMKRVPGISRL